MQEFSRERFSQRRFWLRLPILFSPSGAFSRNRFRLNPDERPDFQKLEFPTSGTALLRRGMNANSIAAALCGLLAAWPGASRARPSRS